MSTEMRKGKRGKKAEMSLDVLKKKLCEEQQKVGARKLRCFSAEIITTKAIIKHNTFWGTSV